MIETFSNPTPDLQALPLTGIAEGTVVRLQGSDIPEADRQLLVALGVIPNRRLHVRKTGSPWIVEVCGVRIGLSRAIAERLWVEPITEFTDATPSPA